MNPPGALPDIRRGTAAPGPSAAAAWQPGHREPRSLRSGRYGHAPRDRWARSPMRSGVERRDRRPPPRAARARSPACARHGPVGGPAPPGAEAGGAKQGRPQRPGRWSCRQPAGLARLRPAARAGAVATRPPSERVDVQPPRRRRRQRSVDAAHCGQHADRARCAQRRCRRSTVPVTWRGLRPALARHPASGPVREARRTAAVGVRIRRIRRLPAAMAAADGPLRSRPARVRHREASSAPADRESAPKRRAGRHRREPAMGRDRPSGERGAGTGRSRGYPPQSPRARAR